MGVAQHQLAADSEGVAACAVLLKRAEIGVIGVAVELDHDAGVVVVEVNPPQARDLHLAPRLGKTMPPAQGNERILEDAVGCSVTRQSRCQYPSEPACTGPASVTRLLQAPLEPGQGAEPAAHDVVDKPLECGLGKAPGEIEDGQVDRSQPKFTPGNDIPPFHQSSSVQPEALVNDSQMLQRGHLDGFSSLWPETVQLGCSGVREDGTSLHPEMCGDEILGSARRRPLDPVDLRKHALPASTGDAQAPHFLCASVLRGLVEMEDTELA